MLGDGWYATHDEWGARCFKQTKHPYRDIFAGDDYGRYASFADLAALEEYTQRRLEELRDS